MISRRGFLGALAGAVAVAHVEPHTAPHVLPSITQEAFRQSQAQKALFQSSAQRVLNSGLQFQFKGAPIMFDEDVPPDRMMFLGSKNEPM